VVVSTLGGNYKSMLSHNLYISTVLEVNLG